MLIDLTVRIRVQDAAFINLIGEERDDFLDQMRKQSIVVCEYHEVKLDKEYGTEGSQVIWHVHESTNSRACDSCIEIAQGEEN